MDFYPWKSKSGVRWHCIWKVRGLQMKVKNHKYSQMHGFFRAQKVCYIRHFPLYSFPRQGAGMYGKGTARHSGMAELRMCCSPAFAFRDSRWLNSTLQKHVGHCGKPCVLLTSATTLFPRDWFASSCSLVFTLSACFWWRKAGRAAGHWDLFQEEKLLFRENSNHAQNSFAWRYYRV